MSFNPALSNHAIERCTATVAFEPALPDKAFLTIADKCAEALGHAGFTAPQTFTLGFTVGPDGAMKSQVPVAAPRIFQSKTGTIAITLSTQGIVFTTTAYVRWQPFIGEFERLVGPTSERFRDVVSISAIRLEYWDRFLWSGDWSTFRPRLLINESSSYVTPAALKQEREWHSHTGWFQRLSDKLRRLVNINVDVSEVVRDPILPGQPSIGIYSSLTDQPNVAGYSVTPDEELNETYIVERLEHQHLELKEILGHIIVDDMATRISLNLKRSAV
jgi:uncharacterized protein (TIGR04255 family)